MRHGGLYEGLGRPVEGVASIAVLRANAVGDFIVATPALHALREAYPDAHISLLGRAWHAQFLADRPSPVDEVIVIPPTPGVGSPPGEAADARAQERFFQAMQERRFDLALQLHGGGRYSNPFVRRLGARLTAGFHTPGAEPLDRMLPYRELYPELLRLLEGVALVGAFGRTVEPRLVVTARDRAEADAAVPPGAARWWCCNPVPPTRGGAGRRSTSRGWATTSRASGPASRSTAPATKPPPCER